MSLKQIFVHMFSLKALLYRLFAVIWTMFACYIWTRNLIESVEVALTVVCGKFVFYGIYEWLHERRR